MTQRFGETIRKIIRWKWFLTLLGISSVIIMLWNSLFERSPIIGLLISIVAFSIGSKAMAALFFFKEKPFVKGVLGFATFICLAALLGIVLILSTVYTQIFSLIGVTSLILVVCVTSALKSSSDEAANDHVVPGKSKTGNIKDATSLILVCFYLAFTAAAFLLLFTARTGEGGTSVWLRIPVYFLLFFFLSSLYLVLILFFTHIPVSLKLLLIFINSFLAHSLFLVVWYPGRYGDPWAFLGEMRFIDREGTIFGYSHVVRNFLIVDLIKYQGLFSLALLLERMTNLDIYVVDFVLVPLLWSLLVPVFLYRIAESMTSKNNSRLPLLTAIGGGLFSTFIYWGALAHANALGFIFLFFSVMLLFKWFVGGGRRFWTLSLIVSILTILTHPQPGIFALVFLFIATVLKSHRHVILKWVSCLLLFLAYPFLLYLKGATFSLLGLVSLENFLLFLSQMATPLFVLLFAGLFFSLKSSHVRRRSVALLLVFYVVVVIGYYISAYGMENLPYGPARIITIEEMLSVPLVALGLVMTASFLRKGFSIIKGSRLKNVSARSFATLMICLFLSVQATLAMYSAYPRDDPPVQPAWYEIEAVYYLNSTSERYVVLCEPGFANLAIGFLGSDYAYGTGHGTFGVPEWNWWVNQYSWEMQNNPSLGILSDAMQRVGATVGYVVVSTRLPEGYELEDIVERVSEVLLVDRVFGNGKLYVFRFSTQVVTGEGPQVRVIYDEGASVESVTTEFSSTFLSEVNYTLTLAGHSSYNITNYPNNWTFKAIYANQQLSGFNSASDINWFIYVPGVAPTDIVQVVWQANNLYPNAGFKDDSFKFGWQTNPYAPGTVKPTVLTDGNILEISWDFTPGEYYYYQHDKRVDVSTDSYPYLFLKWRTTGPIAEVVVSYTEDRSQQQAIVGYGGQSLEWTVTMVKLLPGEQINSITVGITNYKYVTSVSGFQALYVDYILISAKQ